MRTPDTRTSLFAAEGLLLIGGRSTRMGSPKEQLLYNGEPMGKRLIRELSRAAGTLGLSSGSGRVWVSCGDQALEEYAGCPSVRDRYPGCGPIGGIHAGLSVCRQPYLMAAACDMPYLKAELFWYLKEAIKQEFLISGRLPDGAVPVLKGRIQPLAAIYGKSAGSYLEQCIRAGNYRMRTALDGMRFLYVDVSANAELTKMLCNVNTVEEYALLRKEEPLI